MKLCRTKRPVALGQPCVQDVDLVQSSSTFTAIAISPHLPVSTTMPKRSRSPSPPASAALDGPEDAAESAHTPKYTRTSLSPSPTPSSSSSNPTLRPMQCALPPHPPLTLSSTADFDAHYAREHTNRCISCAANLPSAWLLELHQAERHDPLVAARREKGEKTYRCFIPTCEKICANWQKRRMHLVDKHGYPKEYDFRVVLTGIEKRISLLRKSGGAPASGARRRKLSDVGTVGWMEKGRERNGMAATPESNSVSESGERDRTEDEEPENTQATPHKSQETNTDRMSKVTRNFSTVRDRPRQEDGVDQLVNGVAALKFVPLSVRLRAKQPNS